MIPTHKLSDAAFSLTDKTLKSKEFWYCGYELRLVISDIVKDRDLQETYAMFMAKLSLEICNLTEESEVSIQWQPTSQCFKSTPYEQTHTFDKKTSLSSVDIKYKIKVPPLGIIPNDVPLNQSLTTFGTTQSVFAIPPKSDNQTGFTFGTAPTKSGINLGGGRVSDSQTGFTFGTAPTMSGINLGGGRVSDSQTGFTFGTAPTMSGTGFRVPGRTGLTFGAATSESSTNFGGDRVSDSHTGFTFGTAPTKLGTGFPVPGRGSGLTLGAATSESSSNFGGDRVSTTQSVLDQQSPNSPSMYIDVKTKLI